MALFLAVVRPVFDSPGSLKRVLGLPVLGMVSMVDEGTGSNLLRSRIFFVFTIIMLFAVYAGLIIIAPNF